jgi:hypothetical protein
LYMLWSQYKLATIRCTEFLRKEITGIPNIVNQNSNFLTLQTSEFQKTFPTGIFGIKNGIGIPLTMGVPEIGTKNWNSQPSSQLPQNGPQFLPARHCTNISDKLHKESPQRLPQSNHHLMCHPSYRPSLHSPR